MAVLGHTFLGIEINAAEIHIVEVQGSWPQVKLLRAHHSPTPENALECGRIVDPIALGDHLRELLQTVRPGTRDVVVGLSGQALLARTMDVPPVPSNEMRVILSGELSHYQSLQENVDTFDFLPLAAASKRTQGGQSVLVMAAEERIVAGYTETIERAGLRLLALEPLPIALLRTLSSQLQTHPDALCLLIHHGDIEIAMVEGGQIRLYRRLDISSDDLILGKGAGGSSHGPSPPVRTLFGEPDEEESADTAPAIELPLNLSALHALSLELQRSLEYYTCEFSPEQPIGTILLASPHAELARLPEWLANTLSLKVIPAAISDTVSVNASEQPFEAGTPHDRRIGAIGLAMRDMPGLPQTSPRLNLSRQRRPVASEATLRRRLAAVMAVSILLIGCGILLAFRIGLRANHLDHAVSHLKEDIQEMQWDKQNRLDAFSIRSSQLQTLAGEGFAFPRYMDAIADAAGPHTGLLEVSLNRDGQFAIQGEAATEQDIIAILEGLKRSGYLANTSLNSFDSTQITETQFRVIRFQITSHLAGYAPPQVASASANGAK